jgi:hypothetical protein
LTITIFSFPIFLAPLNYFSPKKLAFNSIKHDQLLHEITVRAFKEAIFCSLTYDYLFLVAANYDSTEYVCTLPSKYLKLAEAELRETETTRNHALDAMREWISKHPRIKKSRLGEMPFISMASLKSHIVKIFAICGLLEKFQNVC